MMPVIFERSSILYQPFLFLLLLQIICIEVSLCLDYNLLPCARKEVFDAYFSCVNSVYAIPMFFHIAVSGLVVFY